jgi:transcription antitermination factor NusG
MFEPGVIASSRTGLLSWYAIYTYPRHERAVADQLEHKGVETFLPMSSVESRWKDRTVRLQSPLFPSYVFTRILMADRVTVLKTPGVIRILSANGSLLPILDSEINAVRRCIAGTGLEPHPFVETGAWVRVRSGPFSGLEGIVTQNNNRCKVVISISAIHRSIALEVDCDSLQPILPAKNLSRLA